MSDDFSLPQLGDHDTDYAAGSIRDAPTTQVGKSQPSASTSQTCSGVALILRVLIDMPPQYPVRKWKNRRGLGSPAVR